MNMGAFYGTREIVELEEGSDFESSKPGKKFHVEDDINRLFESIRTSTKTKGLPQLLRDEQKKYMKRPMRVGPYQASGIGISEPVNLKQALRGLSISQASEMAAMKRLSKPTGFSRGLEAGPIKRSRIAAGEEVNDNIGHQDMVEVSLVPETSASPGKIPKSLYKLDNHTASTVTTSNVSARTSVTELGQSRNLKLKLSSLSARSRKKLPVVDEIIPASVEESSGSVTQEKDQKPKLDSSSFLPSPRSGAKLMKPFMRNKNLVGKKNKLVSIFGTTNSEQFNGGTGDGLGSATSDTDVKKSSPASGSTDVGIEDSLCSIDSSASKPALIKKRPNTVVNKTDEKSRAREKGEFSQSSKSSLGECSSSTSFSCDSNLSRSWCRPHMSKDSRWEAVYCAQKQHGSLNLRNFKLIKKIGGGDIGSVYLAELIGSNCFFALKILDNELLALRKKATRAQTEREILQSLDHPFLPTLFSQFTTDKYSCLVIEYCPGGDLHVLRQKQPNKCFSEQATRFYVAEILLALEYLHMLGIVYRDLKPENILVREDGHIMLTDFDLSLRCDPNPTLLKPSPPSVGLPKETQSSCIHPFCLQPSWQVPCFTPRLAPKLKSDTVVQVPQLIVEPTSGRSNSFVGTHEYLAPEIIKGEGHGSPVDWWTFGILVYELLYGRTPFKGTGDDETLANVVSEGLKFPEKPIVSCEGRDLVKSLLRKQPEDRLGWLKGAAEIKQHPFFEGLNWALVRCATPPEMPTKVCDFRSKNSEKGEHLVVDMF